MGRDTTKFRKPRTSLFRWMPTSRNPGFAFVTTARISRRFDGNYSAKAGVRKSTYTSD
jgi:hypothetical protein